MGDALLDSIVDADGAVWMGDILDGQVFRVDPRHPMKPTVIQVTGGISAIAAGVGGLWILDRTSGTVSMIDAATNRPTTATSNDAPMRILMIIASSSTVSGDHSLESPHCSPLFIDWTFSG